MNKQKRLQDRLKRMNDHILHKKSKQLKRDRYKDRMRAKWPNNGKINLGVSLNRTKIGNQLLFKNLISDLIDINNLVIIDEK